VYFFLFLFYLLSDPARAARAATTESKYIGMAAPTQKFPCNTCGLGFEDSREQREHMRSDWHVGNLRRRIVGEGVLAEEEYEEAHPRLIGKSRRRSLSPPIKEPVDEYEEEDDGEQEGDEGGMVADEQCLFCPWALPSIDSTLEHMSQTHGLYIPHVDRIPDLSSFLGFLNTLVFNHHECLYCGAQKASVSGVRTHMRDKGHGKVRWEDVEEFWDGHGEERGEGEEVERGGEMEWQLPSGAIINSRSDSTCKPQHARWKSMATARAAITSTPSSDRQLTRNAELSLSNVADSQIRTLRCAEKKSRSTEAIAKTACRWKMEQAPVLTKYYKKQNPVYQAG
jgi:pre-60S factor REI1